MMQGGANNVQPCDDTTIVCTAVCLAGFEDQDGNLTEIEIDEVLGLVCYVRAKVATHNHVPRRTILLVELLLDVRCHVLLNVVLVQRLVGNIYCLLLHGV